jgi:hypothetical protein
VCSFGKPELFISNFFAWELYQKLSGQVIVAGMGDVLGINFMAIEFIFNLYEIYDPIERQCLFEKIIAVDSVRCKERSQQMQKQVNAAKSKK